MSDERPTMQEVRDELRRVLKAGVDTMGTVLPLTRGAFKAMLDAIPAPEKPEWPRFFTFRGDLAFFRVGGPDACPVAVASDSTETPYDAFCVDALIHDSNKGWRKELTAAQALALLDKKPERVMQANPKYGGDHGSEHHWTPVCDKGTPCIPVAPAPKMMQGNQPLYSYHRGEHEYLPLCDDFACIPVDPPDLVTPELGDTVKHDSSPTNGKLLVIGTCGHDLWVIRQRDGRRVGIVNRKRYTVTGKAILRKGDVLEDRNHPGALTYVSSTVHAVNLTAKGLWWRANKLIKRGPVEGKSDE